MNDDPILPEHPAAVPAEHSAPLALRDQSRGQPPLLSLRSMRQGQPAAGQLRHAGRLNINPRARGRQSAFAGQQTVVGQHDGLGWSRGPSVCVHLMTLVSDSASDRKQDLVRGYGLPYRGTVLWCRVRSKYPPTNSSSWAASGSTIWTGAATETPSAVGWTGLHRPRVCGVCPAPHRPFSGACREPARAWADRPGTARLRAGRRRRRRPATARRARGRACSRSGHWMGGGGV